VTISIRPQAPFAPVLLDPYIQPESRRPGKVLRAEIAHPPVHELKTFPAYLTSVNRFDHVAFLLVVVTG
jgi:hypothetical protein